MFIGRVMLDGRGLVGRYVSVRDLVVWGVVESAMGGSHVLRDLETAGLLDLHTDYGIAAPLEARRWSLPGAVLEGGKPTVTHGGLQTPVVDLPSLRALTGDGCQWLPPALRSLLAWSLPSPLRASAAAEVLRVSVQSVRRWFGRLASAGLVERAGDAWRVVPVERLEAVASAAAEVSADAAAAVERLEAARDRVAEDRAGWRRLWRSSVDTAGRLVWRFRPRRRPAAGRSAEAATCADSASVASPSSTGPLSGVLRRRRGAGLLSSAVQAALPGLEAPPGGWSSVRWSAPPVVMRRSGVERPRGGLSAPGAGECPDG